MKSFFKKIIIFFFAFNLALGRPVLAVVAPTPPPAPEALSAPTPPPSPPSPPEAPSPPSSPSSPETVSGSQGESQINEATNSQTGADSTNQATINNETNSQVENQNQGQVVNEVNSQVSTGGNTASYNTGSGQITTGDAIQNLQVVTNLNQNTTLYSQNGSPLNQANNLLTGSGSQNNSDVTNKLNETIQNNNLGSLTNKILLNSISGQNFSSYNTGAGAVQTGNAVANLSLLSAVNTNVTGTGGMKTFNIYDTHQGNIVFTMADFKDGAQFTSASLTPSYQNASKVVAENSVTGADSENNAQFNNSQTEKIENTNQGVLKNEIVINAVSGENNTNKNTGEGDIQTGDANALATLVNFLNTNLVVDEWMIAVVNIFGQLIGDIILPKAEEAQTSQSLTQNQQATNSLTGSGSDNSASSRQEATAIFTNYNDAKVINNIETTAVTGANTASYNTGPGQVVDGDASVATSEVNVANNNAVGGEETFWLVLVNKMGEWIGSIVGAESGETVAGNLVLSTATPEFNNGNPDGDQFSGNLLTGADSENQASASAQTNVEVENKNQAIIENDVKIVAQSGKNSGSYNTLGGEVEAGEANVGLSLVNFVNNNLVGKKLIVLIVDVLGSWLGDVVPPDQEKQPSDTESQKDEEVITSENMVAWRPESDSQQDNDSVLGRSDFSATYEDTPRNSREDFLVGDSSFNWSGSGFATGPISDLDHYSELIDYRRGLFTSSAFAKETETKGSDGYVEVTSDWLYLLIPSLFGVVLSRSKKMRAILASFL